MKVLEARKRSIGSFEVRRVLPEMTHRSVGPFIFVDEMGPLDFAAGAQMDVLPHPHIGLATVTYLFEGEVVHRDSLGSQQIIRPGDVNWMTAGRGIVHSERMTEDAHRKGGRLHGLQVWVALPREHEQVEPMFHHHPASSLPERMIDGVQVRLLAGDAFDMQSPVSLLSPLFYAAVAMPGGARLALPTEHEERAAYIVSGALRCGDARAQAGSMLVFTKGAKAMLDAEGATQLVLLGGAPLEHKLHMVWNFVSSDRARVEQAVADWKARRFPLVPGDEVEFVPMPE